MVSKKLKIMATNWPPPDSRAVSFSHQNIKSKSDHCQVKWEHLTCAMSINAYSRQKLENLELDHKEK
jgi:hypothetical protein